MRIREKLKNDREINQVVEAQFFSQNVQTHLVNVSGFQNYETNASLCFLFMRTFSCFQKKDESKKQLPNMFLPQ